MSLFPLDELARARFGQDFPLEDSQYFSDTPVDPAIRKETDGGLVFTRPQYRRTAARKIVTGFTQISHAFKELLDEHWENVRGGSGSWYYVHPLSGKVLTVRFEEPYTTAYKGIGTFKVWDITQIKLRTV